MADSKLTTEYRCDYCYVEFNSMTDPRELPCHHVFCITCLQGDYTDNNNICCRSCQRVYNMETFDHLPTASLDTEVVVDTLSSLTCDCHNCDGQNAVCYCVNCTLKMCSTHQQAHASLHGDRHKVVCISTYKMAPGTYKRVLCDHHGGDLTEVCKKCNLYACPRCDRYGTTCSEGMDHTFISLNKLKGEITAHFIMLLQSASERLTEICKLDKHIWKLLDDAEVECKKRIEIIDKICEERIDAIREESVKLKEQIYEYQKSLTDQVELCNTELMDKKEKLEESRTDVHRWLRESHVTEKLQQKQQMTDELREHLDMELHFKLKQTPVIIRSVECMPQYMNLVNTPTSIRLTSEQLFDANCYSSSYQEDGDLLLGCADGVRLLNAERTQIIRFDTNDERVTSVVYHRRNVFVLHRVGYTRTVEMCLPDVEQRQQLFSIQYSSNAASTVAVNDHYVIAIDRANDQLVLYAFLTKQTAILQSEIPARAVHFLPNGDLLVLGRSSGGQLVRYKIEDQNLAIMWICEGLENSAFLSTDADGLIYICARNGSRTIYIVSPEGLKLKEIKNENLPDIPGQISIRGRDELAVPSWDRQSVFLFKINH